MKTCEASEKYALTIEEASKLAGIGRDNLIRWQCTDRSFPSFKIGSKTYISKDLLRDYINEKARQRYGDHHKFEKPRI
jgi:hypothetical protein